MTQPEPVSLPQVSPLGFGCASVMGRVGRAQALDAMACAFDLGVTHFDVARSYGFGDAESVLGHFLRGRRDRVTITSKFGVIAPQLKAWQRLARPLVRPLRRVLAPLRRQVQQASGALLSAHRYDAAYAHACLERSLRQLGTDYIDFYLLHEPVTIAAPAMAALADFLDARVRAGQIRAWGVAHAEQVVDAPVLRAGRVLQHASSLGEGEARRPAWLGEPARRFITRPMGGGDPAARLAPSLLEAGRAMGLSTQALAFHWACHEAGPGGSVIAGMYSRAHVVANVQAVHAHAARAAEFARHLGAR
jgi:aryl-alcohol dehydrogenase-like predicted oxidoreductase